ncbi:amidohydrolase family protein [Horticoccus sp. 23ND18S-11]|uniref:amidohydrolase family protein n=1 Tax=Horticoccus sp. 23ND18S-11 TaxID=3391832 RepID=UPI0039C9591A
MNSPLSLTRRDFLVRSVAALAVAPLARAAVNSAEPIIDIHQHTNYGGRRDSAWRQIFPARSHDELRAHQRAMGVTTTILLPAGREILRESTHQGRSNGLEGTVSGNDDVVALARQFPGEFVFGANEVSDLAEAPSVVEKYLKLGAVIIGEQKFGVQCDSAEIQQLYKLAEAYRVPILMHWQAGSYNYGFERFHTMLKKYPTVNFIGHAQTWWANIDQANVDDPKNLYPKGKVTAGGLTDRYLRDYPNMYADLSAGSGEGAFKRDPEHARAFFTRHQDKLLYGSDCSDKTGDLALCSGARQIAQVRQFSPSKAVERKVLYENAKRLFRL